MEKSPFRTLYKQSTINYSLTEGRIKLQTSQINLALKLLEKPIEHLTFAPLPEGISGLT